MTVRHPGLLDEHLREVERLHPTMCSITIKTKGPSEATLTIPEDSRSVPIHAWLTLYTQRGYAGVYRVSNAAHNVLHETELTLLHGIDVLSDSVWAEQRDFVGTTAQYLETLLSHQTRLIGGVRPWKLGRCEDDRPIEKAINYDRLSTLLEELVEEGGDYCYTYDQTTWPWTVNLVAMSQEPASEFRLARNVQSAAITYNDADLCTRLIVSVNVRTTDKDTGVTSTDTSIRVYDNQEAQSRWGIVVKTADIDTKDDIHDNHFASADEWAQHYLSQRSEPSVQIQIEGRELCRLTGDTWDETNVGTLCQVALPDYGQTYRERVVSATYPDVYGDPERVTVSLANTLPRFSENIANAMREAQSAARSARGAGRGAASAKELTTWSQHVKYYGEALDGTGVMTLYESGIDMDAVGGVKIFSLVEGLQSLYSDIQVNANEIKLEVKRASEAEGEMSSEIRANANEISLKVSKNGIISAINQTAETILIQANRIDLKGYVTADQLDVKIADIEDAWATSLRTGGISCNAIIGGEADFDEIVCGSLSTTELQVGIYTASWKSQTVVTSVSAPSLTWTLKRIYYIDHDGKEQSEMVCTGFSGTTTPGSNTTTVRYLGR